MCGAQTRPRQEVATLPKVSRPACLPWRLLKRPTVSATVRKRRAHCEWPRGALLRGYVSQTSSEMPQRWGEARDTPRPFYEIAHLRVSCVL